jgi:serine/threonine protein kinase
LGQGGFGTVFKAEKISNHKKVAVKVMKIGTSGTKEFEKNYKNLQAEIEIGIKFGYGCRFLVSVLEFFMEDEYCCLVMEFCSGGDLERIFNEKRYLPEKVLIFYSFHIFIFLYLNLTGNIEVNI